MTTTLLIPAAGQSSRYPGLRPKWLLTMPDGRLMVETCVSALDLRRFDRILVACLRAHVDSYLSANGMDQIRRTIGRPDLEFVILDAPTGSQAETVVAAIKQADIQGAMFIKDCDNQFTHQYEGGNEIAAVDLNAVDFIDARSKSYVTADALGYATNIIEKRVISHRFCCGGYGFANAQDFVQHFERITQRTEVYVSHIIYSMILAGERFRVSGVEGYADWGTLREFRRHAAQHLVVFCDIDGVLLKNGGRFAPQGWRTPGLEKNLTALASLQRRASIHLIITSSRPDSEIPYVTDMLGKFGVKADRFVMGLPHARRVLINDYSPSNPYPSAVALNLERDSATLEQLLSAQLDLNG